MLEAPTPFLQRVALAWLGLLAAHCPAAERDIAISGGSESCMTSSCHSDLNGLPFVHALASDAEERPGCLYCHRMTRPGRHAFELAGEGVALCAECHGTQAEGRFVHGAVSAGACTECHDPHQSRDANLLVAAPPALCTVCHDDPKFADPKAHAPVAQGACMRCHDPHASDHAGNLKRAQGPLCLECHERAVEARDDGMLPAMKGALDDPALKRHEPFAEGDCSACHAPHLGGYPRLLRDPYPHGYTHFEPERYMCFECHEEKAFSSPRTLTDTDFRNGNLNLHHRHVNRTKGRACIFCHHHHAAGREALIRKTAPFGHGTLRIASFTRTESGGRCAASCHVPLGYDRYRPAAVPMRVTPREGEDATPEALLRAEPQAPADARAAEPD
jgi:predicted CXXCH cytochrome family protein